MLTFFKETLTYLHSSILDAILVNFKLEIKRASIQVQKCINQTPSIRTHSKKAKERIK